MKPIIVVVGGCGVVAALTIACASYAVRTVPILAPTSYQHQITVGDVVLIADLYDSQEKYQSVFDTAPSYERGYLPINVIVFNNSTEGVTVNPAYISCLGTTGTPHALVPAEDVVENVLRSTVGRFVAVASSLAAPVKGRTTRSVPTSSTSVWKTASSSRQVSAGRGSCSAQ